MFGGSLDEAALAALARRRAVAEAEEWSAMLRFADRRRAESAQAVNPMAGLVERTRIPLEIAQAMCLSEGQVQSRLALVERIRERTPRVWIAFQAGTVDVPRIREISSTIERLVNPESVRLLERRVVTYAASHTVAELRVWLRRFVVRTEADAATARAEKERDGRHVRIDHGDDGMSWVTAYVTSLAAAAIERRLHHESRALPKYDRTLQHKKADLLVAWATCNEAGETAPHADIAVAVDADVLAGARNGFAESPDGAWVAPVDWVVELIRTADPFWFRMVRDPITRDVLSIEYQGRFAPDVLRRALTFRDGVCTSPGCLVPAWACDLDHQVPWPHGPTSGTNLVPRSRRHHAQKGHGFDPPPRISAMEARLLDVIVEYVPAA